MKTPKIECLPTLVPLQLETQSENLLSFAPKLNMKATEFMMQQSIKTSFRANELLPKLLSGCNPETAAAMCTALFSEENSPGCLGMMIWKCQY